MKNRFYTLAIIILGIGLCLTYYSKEVDKARYESQIEDLWVHIGTLEEGHVEQEVSIRDNKSVIDIIESVVRGGNPDIFKELDKIREKYGE